MRYLVILAGVTALCTGPTLAQTAPEPLLEVRVDGGSTPDAARENHLRLADRYLTLTQGGDLVKQMRAQIEQGMGAADLPPEQREWMAASMGDLLADVVQLTLHELRDDVADSFTVAELETAIAFYDSPTGRSVVRKQVDMNLEMQEVMLPLVVPRMASLMEKFCLRFDCSDLSEAAAKQGR